VIPVLLQPEPADFDTKVRRRGLKSLTGKQIDPALPLPKGAELSPFWRDCLDDLYQAYQQTCAYLAVHFERATGGTTADHFIAKSKLPGQAYEWTNLRLASSIVNARKCNFEDVLDPCTLSQGWFRLELVTGHIYPNPNLNADDLKRVILTIERLGLDNQTNRELRARHYEEYCMDDYTAGFLQRRSPFVYWEAKRQGLL